MKLNTLLAPALAGLAVFGALTLDSADAFDHHAQGEHAADAAATDEGWVALFDGTTTDHWRSFKKESFPDRGWVIEGGTLHIQAGARVGDIITKEIYDDFELVLEWKVAEGANSGIFYNVVEEGMDRPWHTGPEYQILDDAVHRDGQNPKTSTGALYALIECNEDKALDPVGEWNTTRIVINGNHVEHHLNGKLVVAYELETEELATLIAESKFSDKPRFARESAGHIVLQDHGDDVWFRNIRIREIEAE